MATEVLMPQITMTMIEGVIAAWHKKKGEPVTEGEPLADIETDKVVQTLNASATGVFLEARAEVGDIVPVGKTICVIGKAGEKAASVPEPAPAPAPKAPEALAATPASSGSAVTVEMPQITMTMIEGVIAAWHKKKGDPVSEGEPLADIETDKVVQTLNASATGVFLEACAEVGDIVPVGKPICVIGEPGASVPEAEAAPVSAPAVKPERREPQSTLSQAETVVAMPGVTPQMKDAVIVRWLCREGDVIAAGEDLCDAEVDDLRRVVKAPEGGVVARLIAQSGQIVKPGDALYALAGASAASVQAPVSSGPVCASPLAKRLAASVGLSLNAVVPTGPGGMIVESDVKKAMLTPQTDPAHSAVKPVAASTAPADDVEVIPFTGIRKRIADNLMITKKTMADVTTFAEVNMGRVKAFRENLHISYNAFILKAAALALGDYPIMNSSIDGDKILVNKSVGLCVAVSTKRGLVTPVMHHAERLNLISIAEQLEDYAERGREGKLTADDFAGGTFTVTNSGTYGALFFTPIINSPQSAILGVGKIMMTPIVDESGAIVAAPMMYACLSYDHRVVDGETAVKFLQRVKFYLEHPDQMTVIRKK